MFARHAGAGVSISPEASRCGHLLTDLRPREQFSRYSWVEPELRVSEGVAAWPLLAPHHPELAAAHLLSALSAGLDGPSAATATAVAAVARLRGSFGPLGHVALAAGLASAEADARIAAADAWAQVARAGRLDPGLAAAAITLGAGAAAFKLTRIADGLRYAAQDPGVAGSVTSACVAAAEALLTPSARPPGLHLLLELAATAAVVAGTIAGTAPLPAALAGLARGKDRTKLAEAARRLAALSAT